MDFTRIDDRLSVAGQIDPDDLADLARAGFRSVICNRPDGESPDQTDQAKIAATAAALGMAFAYLPVTAPTLGPDTGRAFAGLLADLPGPVLAYCRSGARSQALYGLAQRESAGQEPGRRAFLASAAAVTAGGLGLAVAGGRGAAADPVPTSARIVIAGGGAAGLTVANLLMQQLSGARITVIEPRAEHNYQPGYTLVGAGVKPEGYVVLRTADFLPRGATWVQEAVAEIDPDANNVTTTGGQRIDYDYLVVTTGLVLDYAAIQGMSRDLIGQHGIASVDAGAVEATASWRVLSAFADAGGVGLFGRPQTEMKCAGAPLKQTMLADDHLRRRGNRGRAEIIYNAHAQALFGVPVVTARVEELFARQDIAINRGHVLTAIDPGRKIATYATAEGPVEMAWDFINVIPPMRAAEAVRNSPLPWQDGAWAADGWIELDRHTMRHARYPNVFGVGDIAGVPKGKTAASVKWQAPVAVHHLVADIAGRPGTAVYNGYTSCPLITRIGAAMLVEFDYNDNLVPSFPMIDPLAEGWLPWVIKEVGLKATYTAMLRGRA
jgi:sulfide:quinone oxidoreductase